MEGSGAQFVEYMTGLGKEIGGSMLGLCAQFLENDNWAENIQKIQTQIDGFGDKTLEKAIELKLVNADG
ncbi:hypothetical protein LGW71_07010, partial [Streptococcus mutans]|nr:hypothetical protein [Streptococcus mutans]